MPTEIQLREHDCYAHLDPTWTPDTLFSQVPTIITMDARTQGINKLGRAYLFAVFDKTFLHNKTLKVTWRCVSDVTVARNLGYIRIMDGEYDRSSMVDFPPTNFMITKGAGELFSYVNHNNVWTKGWDWFETVVTPDLSGATLSKVTLFIELNDAWLSWGSRMYIDCIRIYEGAVLIWQANMTASVTMDVTGTDNDYGTAGEAISSPEFIEELTISHTQSAPADAGGCWAMGIWVRKIRGRYDKIELNDHNIPRTVLIKARDVVKENE